MKRILFVIAVIGVWVASKIKLSEPPTYVYEPPDIKIDIKWENGTELNAMIYVDEQNPYPFMGTFQELEQHIFNKYGLEVEYFEP